MNLLISVYIFAIIFFLIHLSDCHNLRHSLHDKNHLRNKQSEEMFSNKQSSHSAQKKHELYFNQETPRSSLPYHEMKEINKNSIFSKSPLFHEDYINKRQVVINSGSLTNVNGIKSSNLTIKRRNLTFAELQKEFGEEITLIPSESPDNEQSLSNNTMVNRNINIQGPKIQQNNQKKKLVTYIGAVLEYQPYSHYDDTEMGFGILRQNAENILKYAEQAKNQYGADLLISPEYGLQSTRMLTSDFEEFVTYTTFVPDPKNNVIPCEIENDFKNFEVMKIMSCGAIKNKIYLVINLSEMLPCTNETTRHVPWQITPSTNCPETGYIFYNTEVVFDRQGTVVARYRKQNLFMEDQFEPGPKDDKSAIFVSDFNVKFSLQTCFDIIYGHPGRSNILRHGVKDILMSTAWVNYLPHFLANSNQAGWSRGMGVNLLVSGYFEPQKFKMGSGIFREFMKEDPVYSFDSNSGNILIVANVTTIFSSKPAKYGQVLGKQKIVGSPKSKTTPDKQFELKNSSKNAQYVYEDLSSYTAAYLLDFPNYISSISMCMNRFCCNLTYHYNGSLSYSLLMKKTQILAPFDQYSLGVKVCSLIWCRKPTDRSTCADIESGLPESDYFGPFKLTLTADYSIKSTIFSVNHRNLSLIDKNVVQFKKLRNGYSLEARKPVKDLLVAALIRRRYNDDE